MVVVVTVDVGSEFACGAVFQTRIADAVSAKDIRQIHTGSSTGVYCTVHVR